MRFLSIIILLNLAGRSVRGELRVFIGAPGGVNLRGLPVLICSRRRDPWLWHSERKFIGYQMICDFFTKVLTFSTSAYFYSCDYFEIRWRSGLVESFESLYVVLFEQYPQPHPTYDRLLVNWQHLFNFHLLSQLILCDRLRRSLRSRQPSLKAFSSWYDTWRSSLY